jgi:release factor glutamine methyltransferase
LNTAPDFENLRLDEVLKTLRERLAGVSETAGLDAQVLLAHITGKPRAWVLAHLEDNLGQDAARHLRTAVDRLIRGEPLPYILGRWEFYGLDFIVSPAVLIPRPETELLVENAIHWMAANPGKNRAADVGTGSGCIAVTLAVYNPLVRVVAADISRAALQVASQNIERHGVKAQVYPVECDLLTPAGSRFDLICANLPYISQETLPGLKVFYQEPPLALAGGLDGLTLIRRLLTDAVQLLHPGGLLLAEIEASQGGAAYKIADQYFQGASIEILKDLAGNDRLLKIVSKGKGNGKND